MKYIVIEDRAFEYLFDNKLRDIHSVDSLEKDCRGIAETVSDLLDEFLVVGNLAVPTVHIFTENVLEELKRNGQTRRVSKLCVIQLSKPLV